MSYPSTSDIVSLIALRLAAAVGPDHWHRTRPQPIHLTLHLHLSPSYLDTPGQSDNVTDSLHYGHLAKIIQKRVDGKAEKGADYASPRALAEDVTDAAFEFVRDAVGSQKDMAEVIRAVRVILQLPKQILLAQGFEIELTTRASDWSSRPVGSTAGAIVRVKDLIVPVLIGVNPPERLAKQHVITNLTFSESPRKSTDNTEIPSGGLKEMDYPSIVRQIVKASRSLTFVCPLVPLYFVSSVWLTVDIDDIQDTETSTHLTLEKLVYEMIHIAYRALDAHPNSSSNVVAIDAITVRCEKPSALSFADASGVEMTRKWGIFGLHR